MRMTKDNLRQFREDFAKVVAKLAETHGVEISLGRLTFTESEFRGKLTVRNKGAAPTKPTGFSELDPMSFASRAPAFLVKPDCWGKTLIVKGTAYKIVGLNMTNRNKKSRVVIKAMNGRRAGQLFAITSTFAATAR